MNREQSTLAHQAMLRKLVNALEVVTKSAVMLDGKTRDVNVGEILAFFYIAISDKGEDGVSISGVQQLGGWTNMVSPSRYIRTLSTEMGRNEKEGMGWVKYEVDPHDNRKRILRLTPCGMSIIDEVGKAMGF